MSMSFYGIDSIKSHIKFLRKQIETTQDSFAWARVTGDKKKAKQHRNAKFILELELENLLADFFKMENALIEEAHFEEIRNRLYGVKK